MFRQLRIIIFTNEILIFIEQKECIPPHIHQTLTLNTKNLQKQKNQDVIQELEVNQVLEIEKKEAKIQELLQSLSLIVLEL